MTHSIRIQEQDFNLNEEYQLLRQDCPSIGAAVTFVGLMREFNDGDEVSSLYLEHYSGMTEKVLEKIVLQAQQRWKLQCINIIHRVGELRPSDQIVYVGVTSAHRGEAFSACEFIMDFLKTQAPFWKKEQTSNGERWVDAKESDQNAQQRWQEAQIKKD